MSRVVIIGYVWPEPESSAAGRRIVDLFKLYRGLGAELHFASAAQRGERCADLESLGVHCHTIALNCSSFDRWLKALQPSAVIFDRFISEEQFGWRAERACPEAMRILDTEDLHFLRAARQQAHREQRELNDGDFCSEMALREIASIWRCDLSLIISRYEMALLQQRFAIPDSQLLYLPLLQEGVAGTPRDFDQRRHCMMIGNFRHAPNWDAVQFLQQQIWPRVRRELPEVECHIYGAYQPPKAASLHRPEQGFLLRGWAEDAHAVTAAARLSLAPLRFGAGQKGKLIQAMACGTPSVTTGIGAEGMAAAEDWPGAVADEAGAIAEAILQLYRDRDAWTAAQQRGFALLRVEFDFARHAKRFAGAIGTLAGELSQRRQQNFTGMMLRHHSLRSHQYMSQWIEAKTRLGALAAPEEAAHDSRSGD